MGVTIKSLPEPEPGTTRAPWQTVNRVDLLAVQSVAGEQRISNRLHHVTMHVD